MDTEKPKFHKAVFEKAITFMLAGLGFVVALAWNDAVQSLFNQLFGPTGNTVIAKFIHALFITAIATIIAVRLGRDIGPK